MRCFAFLAPQRGCRPSVPTSTRLPAARQLWTYALVLARGDGQLGPQLKPWTVDREALRTSGGTARPPPRTAADFAIPPPMESRSIPAWCGPFTAVVIRGPPGTAGSQARSAAGARRGTRHRPAGATDARLN